MNNVRVGMTGEILEKLQEKATVLTQERKRRGRTVPQVIFIQGYLISLNSYFKLDKLFIFLANIAFKLRFRVDVLLQHMN